MNKLDTLQKDMSVDGIILCEFDPASLLMVAARPDLPILIFTDFWEDDKFPTKIIGHYDLTAFFYKPIWLEYVENDVIAYYNVAERPYPVISKNVTKKMKPADITPKYTWDTTYGTRNFPNVTNPLKGWTDKEIQQALKILNVPTERHCLALAA